MNADWEPGGVLLEVFSHLNCALIVSLPTDEPIMMDHVKAAYALMEAARLKAIKEEMKANVRYENSSPYFSFAIRNARAQASGVANPVTREQLRESIDVAERAKR